MSKRITTSFQYIVCLALLVVGLVLLTNVSTAHASTSNQATSNPGCTLGANKLPTDGTAVKTSPVTGRDDMRGLWVNIGEVVLMWSGNCSMNWAVFDPTASNLLYTGYAGNVALYLYSQGGGSKYNPGCVLVRPCYTSPLKLDSIRAQAVVHAIMKDYENAASDKGWPAYGIASQY